MADRQSLEAFFGMSSGYVLNFSDSTFGEFVFEKTGIDIHSSRYTNEGTSKAKKLRAFWKLESDYTVGKLLLALIDYNVALDPKTASKAKELAEQCRRIATRLLAGGPSQPHRPRAARKTHGNKSKIGVWDEGWRELAPYRTGCGSPPSLFDLLREKTTHT
jgi:hypothetical protein